MDRPMVWTPRIAAALAKLQQARIRRMSQREADQTLAILSRIQSIAASLMCDITVMLVATDTRATNGPIEGINNLLQVLRRAAHGFTNRHTSSQRQSI